MWEVVVVAATRIYLKMIELVDTSLKTISKCSFTACKFRFFNRSRLVSTALNNFEADSKIISREKLGIKRKLALATCSLLSQQANSEAIENEWELDASFATYAESDDRVSVEKFVVDVSGNISEKDNVDLKVVFDTMTGSTPTGAVERSNVVSVTGTSGAGGFTATGEATALAPFDDTRLAVNLSWEHEKSPTSKRTYGANMSVESDYISLGGNYSWAKDSADKLTTYALGVSFSHDEMSQNGGMTPDPLAEVNDADFFGRGERNSYEYMAGISRVINHRMLWQNNIWFSMSDGYHTDPYKVISVIANQEDLQQLADQTIEDIGVQIGLTLEQMKAQQFVVINQNTPDETTLDVRQLNNELLAQRIEFTRIYEGRPDKRSRQVFRSELVYGISDLHTMHLSYRYYSDDWDIDAHTIDYRHRFKFGNGQFIEPHIRYYKQSAAEFFTPALQREAALPLYASADGRLDDSTGVTLGVNFGKPVGLNGGVRARLEFISWEAEDAVIRETNAFLLQLSFKKGF